jgi:murein endopeptidase/LysM repeat protein
MLAPWLLRALLAATATAPAPPLRVEDPAALFVSPTSVERLEEPRWIVHTVVPGEKLARIAARYAVEAAQIRTWNHLDPNEDPTRRRRTLRIQARRVPPAPVRIAYVVQAGEHWDDIAAKLRVRRRALQASHRRMPTPVAGATVVAWLDPVEGPTFEPDADDLEHPITLRDDARSTGTPQRGRLEHGIALPPGPLWELAHPTRAFGSRHTVDVVHRAFLHLRNEVGYRGAISIGALSRPSGGRFRPHVSHQSGRDIDIRLPLRPGLEDVRHPTVEDIDWYATWAIVDAFVGTGEVEAIFLEMGRQERLYSAARAMGVERERLAKVILWPNWSGRHHPLVRHSDGHDTHIHVRIRCGDDEPRCKSESDRE